MKYMTFKATTMVEMVRAYAQSVNIHKPIDVVEQINNLVVHKLSNLFHTDQIEYVTFNPTMEKQGTLLAPLRVDDYVRSLYQYAVDGGES